MGDDAMYYADLDDAECFAMEDDLHPQYPQLNRLLAAFEKILTPRPKPPLTRETRWRSYDGRKTRIADMEDSHLFNVAAYLERRDRGNAYGYPVAAWRREFLNELQRRVWIGTPAGTQYILHKDGSIQAHDCGTLDCIVEQLLADTAVTDRSGFTYAPESDEPSRARRPKAVP